MAKKITRKKKRKSRKRPDLKSQLLKSLVGLFILALLVVAAGFLTHLLMKRKEPVRPLQAVKQPPLHEQPATKAPTFEIYPKKELPHRKPTSKPKVLFPSRKPKVAIIIDDLGYDRTIAGKFLELDAVLTFSMLPDSPFQKKIAGTAHAKGHDIMLHLPMEPVEYPDVNPGTGALLTTMTPDQLISQLNKYLEIVPFIKGVNNHMGSKMTTASSQMYQIFSVLKKRGLFFIDSRSTPETLCKPSARLFQIPFAERDIFIDHLPEPGFIRKQLNRLVEIANQQGEAIGIAHPHRVTLEVLQSMIPELKQKVLLVPASEVVHIIG
ncbi:divergent polysaccharide deacetylase family protein [Thermodesulfobacteriota bacterium]